VNVPTGVEREWIPGASIKSAVVDAAAGNIVMFDVKNIVPWDGAYFSYTVEELRDWLEQGQWIADRPYKPNTNDCDDFAISFMVYVRQGGAFPGAPFGLIRLREDDRITAHMANIFIDADLTVWLVDWRLTDEFVKLKGSGFIIFDVEV